MVLTLLYYTYLLHGSENRQLGMRAYIRIVMIMGLE